jgi:Fe-S-cluster containining protein
MPSTVRETSAAFFDASYPGEMSTPSCLRCGACCFSTLDSYVRVSGDDHTRLGEHAERLTHFVGNRCYMRMHQGHCAALVVDAEGSFVCSVYEQRPDTCRELARESPQCEAERLQKAERPLLLRARHGARDAR